MRSSKVFRFPVSIELRLRGVLAAGVAGALALGVTGCKSKNQSAPIVGVSDAPAPAGDPADANSAPAYTGGSTGGYSTGAPAAKTRVLGQSQSFAGQSRGESYPQENYPQQQQQGYSSQGGYPPQGYSQDPGQGYGYGDPNAYGDTEQAGEDAMAESDQPPPPLPQYDQPPAPEQNDLWTPGYWGYAPTGYYWVPGAWCAPPFYGALWTPGWWGFYGGHYGFHHGYWGPHVGYYGGINYGFGYIGTGYYGGYWRGHDFLYNRAVTNVNTYQIHDVYNREVVYNGRQYGPMPDNRVSYNGGRGGINYQPRPYELAASREPHYAPLPAQRELRVAAASNRGQFAGVNGGRPAQAFAGRPVGATTAIASAPREQPFNHPNSNPGFNAAGGRPGQPGQPALARGEASRTLNEGNRPGVPQAPVNNGRQGTPANAQPGTREGQVNNLRVPPGAGNEGQRDNRGFEGRPGTPAAGQTFPQRSAPATNQERQERPAPEFGRTQPQSQQRPAPQVEQRPAPRVEQPRYQQRAAPQPEQRPEVEAPRAQPAPQARPQAPAASPAPAPRPAPESRPAPAPHAEGGGEHGHH